MDNPTRLGFHGLYGSLLYGDMMTTLQLLPGIRYRIG
jgi:hypothetical protein